MMSMAPDLLRVHLDATPHSAGARIVAIVIANGKGEQLVSACERVKGGTALASLYQGIFSMLEEAVVLEARGLHIQFSPQFAAIHLRFDPEHAQQAGDAESADICARIRELVDAFEVINSVRLNAVEENPATRQLALAL